MAHAMHFFEENLYVVGGKGTESRVAAKTTVQCYNIKSGQVTILASLPFKRSFAAHALYNGKIYICGGFGDYSTDSIQVYDILLDCWKVEICKLPAPMFDGAGVVCA